MSELTVRVDPATGRMVADLSHFLGRTKKAVVRDAVRAFAEMHEQSVRRGISHSSDRAAAATGAVDRERLLAEAGGDVMSLGLPSRVTVLREDLARILDGHGARNVRLVGRLARGEVAEAADLLVESDLIDGMDYASATHDAQRLLRTTVNLHDATRLRLFAPDRLAELEREAVPL
jgi:predicted transcriptional regulator/predicted nucleotidyltransferase